jgi:hypothetical protein
MRMIADGPSAGRASGHSSRSPGAAAEVRAAVYSPPTMSARHLYKVIFAHQGKVWEIYARSVNHGAMLGFVEVERLVFGERSSVVVDPAEERIKGEFEGVKRTYIPLHSVLRIDEVEKQGAGKISTLEGGNVAQFPLAVYTPGGPGEPGK